MDLLIILKGFCFVYYYILAEALGDTTLRAVFFDGTTKSFDISTIADAFPEFKRLTEGPDEFRRLSVDAARTHVTWNYNLRKRVSRALPTLCWRYRLHPIPRMKIIFIII